MGSVLVLNIQPYWELWSYEHDSDLTFSLDIVGIFFSLATSEINYISHLDRWPVLHAGVFSIYAVYIKFNLVRDQ